MSLVGVMFFSGNIYLIPEISTLASLRFRKVDLHLHILLFVPCNNICILLEAASWLNRRVRRWVKFVKATVPLN